MKFATSRVLQKVESEKSNEPVQFSGSAADRDAYETFKPPPPRPKHEGHIVKLSLAVFLLYFLLLREENDLDDYISANIYNVMDPYAEIKRLEERLKEEEESGLDTRVTKAALLELKATAHEREGSGALEATLKRAEAAKLKKDIGKI